MWKGDAGRRVRGVGRRSGKNVSERCIVVLVSETSFPSTQLPEGIGLVHVERHVRVESGDRLHGSGNCAGAHVLAEMVVI